MQSERLLGFAVLAAIVCLGPPASAQTGGADSATYAALEKFADILVRAEHEAVVPVDDEKVIDAAINSMLQAVDEDSWYINAEEFKSLQQAKPRPEFAVTFARSGETNKIVSVVSGSTAEKGGVQPGDYIIAVNDKSALGLAGDKILRLFPDEPGPVKISVIRDMSRKLDVMPTLSLEGRPSVTSRAVGEFGYVRIAQFTQTTGQRLKDAIETLKRGNIKGLVLDLRDSPGGLFDQIVGAADEFLDGGVIAITKGRDDSSIERYNAKRGDRLEGAPVVVLINEGTASGAEVVAAALQDARRAKIIGAVSYGKGSLQTMIPVKGGREGAVRLTTAYILRPSGAALERVGVTPDISVIDRVHGGTDLQMDRAVQELKSSISPR